MKKLVVLNIVISIIVLIISIIVPMPKFIKSLVVGSIVIYLFHVIYLNIIYSKKIYK